MSQDFNSKDPNRSIDSDEEVGYGAVVQGTIFTGEGALDSAGLAAIRLDSFAHGSRIVSGVITKLTERNTTVPTKKVQTLAIYADTSQNAQRTQPPRQIPLDGIPPAP